MMYNHYWFDSFKEWNSIFNMRDDWMGRVKGSSTMQINMHDGMARKLDCWFVTDLLKNLISLGTLVKDRFKYYRKGDWLGISEVLLWL